MIMKPWPEGLPREGNQRYAEHNSQSGWFKIYEIDDNTYAILEPNHDEEVISYLVLGRDRAALIDSGMGIGDIKQEIDALTSLPVVVINTHGHFDHIGGNHQFSDIRIFDDPYELNCVEQGHGRETCARFMPPGSYMNLPEGFDPDRYMVKAARVSQSLKHNEVIELGGRSLTVLHTPGHSPGSICLLESTGGLLFSGDTIYPGTMFAFLDGSDLKAYGDSLRQLTGLSEQVSQLCPAHNEAYMHPEMISKVNEAFELIDSGQAQYEAGGGTRLYRFDGFAVRV